MIYYLILIFCISLDVFVVMMEKGATNTKITIKKACIHSLIFAMINTLMYGLGDYIPRCIYDDYFFKRNYIHANIVFVLIALHMFYKATHKKTFNECLKNDLVIKKSMKLAILTGIDCLFVGVGCNQYILYPELKLLIVFGFTFILAFIALMIGYYCGAVHQKMIYYACGCVYGSLALLQIVNLV